jgi:hypothetical protein
MKELRTLLIDCRIELRKLVRDFHKTELCERLDVAVQSLANAGGVEMDLKQPPKPEAVQNVKETSNQVALAWQTAARDLKFTHPTLYDQMSKKVMSKLGVKTLVDQVDELRQLEDSVGELKKQQQVAGEGQQAWRSSATRCSGAWPRRCPSWPTAATASAWRWRASKRSSARRTAAAVAAVAGRRAAAGAVAAEEENRIPSAEVLATVAAARAASPTRSASGAWARRWCCRASSSRRWN